MAKIKKIKKTKKIKNIENKAPTDENPPLAAERVSDEPVPKKVSGVLVAHHRTIHNLKKRSCLKIIKPPSDKMDKSPARASVRCAWHQSSRSPSDERHQNADAPSSA